MGGKPRKVNCKWVEAKKAVKTPVVVMVERNAEGRPGRARTFTMDTVDEKGHKLTQSQMNYMVVETVDGLSEIHTDQSNLYAELNEKGFIHESVCHNDRYVSPDGHVHINGAESFNALPKRMHYGIYHKMVKVAPYMEEATYHWNHRKDNGAAFDAVMGMAIKGGEEKKSGEVWPPVMDLLDDGQMMLF